MLLLIATHPFIHTRIDFLVFAFGEIVRIGVSIFLNCLRFCFSREKIIFGGGKGETTPSLLRKKKLIRAYQFQCTLYFIVKPRATFWMKPSQKDIKTRQIYKFYLFYYFRYHDIFHDVKILIFLWFFFKACSVLIVFC